MLFFFKWIYALDLSDGFEVLFVGDIESFAQLIEVMIAVDLAGFVIKYILVIQ